MVDMGLILSRVECFPKIIKTDFGMGISGRRPLQIKSGLLYIDNIIPKKRRTVNVLEI
jgi:hypothetical protein